LTKATQANLVIPASSAEFKRQFYYCS